MSKLPTTVPGGSALFQRVYTRLNCEGRPPRFHVDFYSYKSLPPHPPRPQKNRLRPPLRSPPARSSSRSRGRSRIAPRPRLSPPSIARTHVALSRLCPLTQNALTH